MDSDKVRVCGIYLMPNLIPKLLVGVEGYSRHVHVEREYFAFLVTCGGVAPQFESFNNNCYRTCNYDEHDISDIEKLIELFLKYPVRLCCSYTPSQDFEIGTVQQSTYTKLLSPRYKSHILHRSRPTSMKFSAHHTLFVAHARGSGNETSVERYE